MITKMSTWVVPVFCAIFSASCASSKVAKEPVAMYPGTKLLMINELGRNARQQAANKGLIEATIYQTTARINFAEVISSATSVKVNLINGPHGLAEVARTKISEKKYADFADGYYRFAFEGECDGCLDQGPLSSNLYRHRRKIGNEMWGHKMRFIKPKVIAQPITFPFKYRPMTEFNGSDKPYQVSTNFNGGFAFGANYFSESIQPFYNIKTKKMVNLVTRRLSTGFAVFGGLTTIGYSESNVKDVASFERDRTVLGGTYGASYMITFDRFTGGLSVGRDAPWGDERSNWIYHKKWWCGLIIGLDVFR